MYVFLSITLLKKKAREIPHRYEYLDTNMFYLSTINEMKWSIIIIPIIVSLSCYNGVARTPISFMKALVCFQQRQSSLVRSTNALVIDV